jgi:environmental stress-induced protein Ves
VKIVRASDCRTTAWKNGGGSTTEIAVAPLGASLDDFDWRVSMARVASDGPFSEFAGIDRTLAIVKGKGLSLIVGDAAPVVLNTNSTPMRFAGDAPTTAQLLTGDIIDLNVMTRRDRFEHRLLRVREPTLCDLDGYDLALAVACSGNVELTLQQEIVTLSDGDAAILTRASDAPFRITPTTSADCYLVLLRACRNHAG